MSGLKVIFSVLTLPHFFLILSCLPFQIPKGIKIEDWKDSLRARGQVNCCLDSQQKLLKKKSCGVFLFISGSLGFGNKSYPIDQESGLLIKTSVLGAMSLCCLALKLGMIIMKSTQRPSTSRPSAFTGPSSHFRNTEM